MKIQYAALLSFVLAGAVGCGKSGGTKIAVIPKGSTHEFWKSVHKGAEKAGKELGVEIVWKGPVKEDDRQSQQDVVADFVTKGVSGIVLAPLDSSALVPSVEEAAKQKIPVVIIDSGLDKKEYVSFVATDNYKGGSMAGDHLAKLLGGKGRVIMMRYQEGSASTMERERGFMDAMKKNPDIKVVSSNQYGGATTESAQKTAENILAPYKQGGGLSVDGIFCPNESTCVGMLRVLEDAGVAGKVKYVGFDSSPTLLDALKKGEIHGLILQNPVNMGYMGVKTMVAHLKGEKVEDRIDTGATLATKENMKDPKIAALLDPLGNE